MIDETNVRMSLRHGFGIRYGRYRESRGSGFKSTRIYDLFLTTPEGYSESQELSEASIWGVRKGLYAESIKEDFPSRSEKVEELIEGLKNPISRDFRFDYKSFVESEKKKFIEVNMLEFYPRKTVKNLKDFVRSIGVIPGNIPLFLDEAIKERFGLTYSEAWTAKTEIEQLGKSISKFSEMFHSEEMIDEYIRKETKDLTELEGRLVKTGRPKQGKNGFGFTLPK